MNAETGDLEKIYQRRFRYGMDFRKKMWQILCHDFFQKYIPADAVVLEIGAGYCEFINSVKAGHKIAVDLNSDAAKFADKDIEVIISESVNMGVIGDESCDIVLASNFFEHLSKPDIKRTIKEACRILKRNGKFLILQPNIRFCYKDYWNFFDHITPLDDLSLREILEIDGFEVIESRPKFLPYAVKSRLPKAFFLIRLYLRIPFLQYVFGKQAFVCARKI